MTPTATARGRIETAVLARRLVTIPTCLVATGVLTAALPGLAIVAGMLSLLPALRGALPTLAFLVGYLWCESAGIVAACWLWVRHRELEAFLAANHRLQCWWSSALKRLAETLFRLEFHVSGSDALEGTAALMLPRHASIADTVIPIVFYAIPSRVRLRYVLKRELLLDPCLDLVGNRLPNYFVDRGGQDSERARRGVFELVAGLRGDEGLLLYPEGTRFTAAKRSGLQRRYADNTEMLAQLARWEVLLPPRLGGFLAMLEANPGRDLVFCAHTGFEGSSHFSTLVNGSWMRARIGIHFWRVPFAAIPATRQARIDFVFDQWDRMQQTVIELTRNPAAQPSLAATDGRSFAVAQVASQEIKLP